MTSTRRLARLCIWALVLAASARAGATDLPARNSHQPPPAASASGVAISPEVARSLFDSIRVLHASDGCRLAQFNTERHFIDVGLIAATGAPYGFAITAVGSGFGGSTWTLSAGPEVTAQCGETLAAVRQILAEAEPPMSTGAVWAVGRWRNLRGTYGILAASFVLLLFGSIWIAIREVRSTRPPAPAVLALLSVSLAALALRGWLSPHTFLHEYYHIAETISAYLAGSGPLTYGKTGPAMFRLAAAVFGRPFDVGIIFWTNAVLASLAVPAAAAVSLSVTGRWSHALATAVLLCILPHHLRFSASEVLFVQSITFAMWSLALFALYLRTRRLFDALIGVLALSLAMQSRPEMLILPGLLVAFAVLVEPKSWRVLFAWRTLLALAVLGLLLTPRLLELPQALHGGPIPHLPEWDRYSRALALLQDRVTPWPYRVMLAVGSLWTLWRRPGLLAWVALVFFGYTVSSLALFDNPQYNLRAQLLPTSFTVLIAAGTATAWLDLFGRRRVALAVGTALLATLAVSVTAASRGFVTELRDQQLEFAFLDRTVPQLPKRATLLTAAEVGGWRLNAFPEFLLQRDGKSFEQIDVRDTAHGSRPWPEPGRDLLYYQGMYCFFAFDDEPSPDPMTPVCRAVHDRYDLQPLFVETLDCKGYSWLRYARGPYQIGFFRLRKDRQSELPYARP